MGLLRWSRLALHELGQVSSVQKSRQEISITASSRKRVWKNWDSQQKLSSNLQTSLFLFDEIFVLSTLASLNMK